MHLPACPETRFGSLRNCNIADFIAGQSNTPRHTAARGFPIPFSIVGIPPLCLKPAFPMKHAFSASLRQIFRLPTWLLALFLLPDSLPAAEQIAFTFVGENNTGGVALLQIEDNSFPGKPRVLVDELPRPFKLEVSPDGSTLAVVAGGKNSPRILWIPRPETTDPDAEFHTHPIEIETEVSDIAFAGDSLLVAAGKGRFHQIVPPGEIRNTLNARKALSPPGHKGEDFCVLDDSRALISFQKDDSNTDALGNRLVLLDLNRFTFQHDISLRESLELPDFPPALAPSILTRGPNPEVILAFPESDTVCVSLDSFGAILFADLSSLLKGRLSNPKIVSTAPDGHFGTSFPDRLHAFSHGGSPKLLVSNACPLDAGGALIFLDVSSRAVLASYPTPCGAEIPVQSDRFLATVLSGKTKLWQDGEVTSQTLPRPELIGFELPEDSTPLSQESIRTFSLPLPIDPVSIIGLPGGRVVVLGKGDAGAEALLINLATPEILARQPLPGSPVRATLW